MTERAVYDPYGNVQYFDGSYNPGVNFLGIAFGYQVLLRDPVTGLYNNKARFYDPTTGRFLQTDPDLYINGMNDYWSRADNPINMVDPEGTDAWGLPRCPKAEQCLKPPRIGKAVELASARYRR